MITSIAIDDEPLALEVLKKYASQTPSVKLVATFSDAIEAVQYLQQNPVRLLLLDIQMPDINGFQLYRDLAVKPLVIFTTAYKEYAIDGFEADAVDYLLKPFNLARFQKAVTKALARDKQDDDSASKQVPQYLYIHEDYKMVKIPLADIIFIEALDDYARIHTDARSYLTLLPLKKLMEKLPPQQFIRIHRSYIVASDKVSFAQFRKLGLSNGQELPIGDTYRSEMPDFKKL